MPQKTTSSTFDYKFPLQEESEETEVNTKEKQSKVENVKVQQDRVDGKSEEKKEKILHFRSLLKAETERIGKLCEHWEDLNKTVEDISEDVRGEVRCVVGLGRLVMAERFTQFSGLVDNCQLSRGEKETTVEDLRGFWEMIYIQVEDVDKRFDTLKIIQENNWQRPKPGKVSTATKKLKISKSASSEGKPAQKASSGLKALIAARRKAAKSSSEVCQISDGTTGANDSNPITEERNEPPSEVTFDGGFFKVTSPCLRKSPTMKSSNIQLRQAAVINNASATKRSGLLLSPFISAVAKMSLTAGQITSCPHHDSSLFMSYPLLGSHLSISPFGPSNGALSVASVQTRLFKEEEEDGDEKASPVRTAKL